MLLTWGIRPHAWIFCNCTRRCNKNELKVYFLVFLCTVSTAVLRKQTAHALTFLIACASVSVYIWHSQVECMRSWTGSFLRMHVRALQVFRIQREAVLRTPSLPIPLQVHMCFISRPAHWTVNSSGGLAWGICAARGWERAIAGNKRQALKESPCSDSVSCRPLKPPTFFPLLLDPPSFFRCSSRYLCLITSSFLETDLFRVQLCIHAVLCMQIPFFAFLSLSGCFPHHVWSFAATPTPPQPLCRLIPVVQAILALFLFMFVCCDTASEKEPQHFHHSKHLRRPELCLKQWFPFALEQNCSLFFSTPRHTHTHTDSFTLHSQVSIIKIYVSLLIFQSLSSPSTWQSQLERDMAGHDLHPPDGPWTLTPSSGYALTSNCTGVVSWQKSASDKCALKSKHFCLITIKSIKVSVSVFFFSVDVSSPVDINCCEDRFHREVPGLMAWHLTKHGC